MKKASFIFSFVLAATLTSHAQNKDTETADKLYARLEYVDAAEEYKKLVKDGKQDEYVYKQLAESYYNVFNYKEAAKWYAKVVEKPQSDPEIYFKYAQMLKAEGKYEESNKQMKKFASMAPKDQRAVDFMKDPDYLPKLRNQTKLYDTKAMTINSDKSDFGAVLASDNYLYFTSARNKSRKTYGWNEEPFLDMYQSVQNADGTFSEPTPITSINSKWHDGPATVSADGKTMYFSSESFKEKEFVKDRSDKKNKMNRGQIYIYKATKDGDAWGNIKEVSFNNKQYSTGNPSLSKDGKTLYFTSDMPGGFGGSDIWRVSVNGDTFGTPENLGKDVNTEGNENFPFITDENKLFFSSDGKKGFGGLDVFVYDMTAKGEVKNVGEPVNGPKDDFAFSFNVVKNIGFFSSNREGNDNLFSAVPVCVVEVFTTVQDAVTLNPIGNARVSILDDRNNVIETKTSGVNGLVIYTVDCNKKYRIQASAEGYENGTFDVAASVRGGKVDVPANLNPIEKIVTPEQVVLNDIYFEFNKSNITKEGAYELDKLVEAMKKYPDMVIMVKSHTDNRGSDQYNMNLSDRRAKSTVQYVLSKGIAKARISGKGFGESEPKVDCGANCTEEQHAQNRRSEFLIVKQ